MTGGSNQMKYYSEKTETASRDELERLQSERLINTVKRVYENVELYRKRMDEAGISPSDIKSVKDLSRLPFTYKTDLRETYPFGMFACKKEDVVRIHASSGTTGKPTVVGYTKNDLAMWSECVARALAAAGVEKSDRVHVSYGYGLFTGGLGIHSGIETLGAAVIPASTGNTAKQIQLLKDFDSTVLCSTPSYALYIADVLAEKGETLNLKTGIFGAEPWTENMRKAIEDKLHLKAYDIYGLSEVAGPGVAFECEQKCGLHVNEDNFIPEIINPDTGKLLPDGEEGELVFTCITKEALPLIRYRTHDIASITHEKCACGRTFVRMSKPVGRSDDMLIIRGVNVFPSQIENVLMSFSQVSPFYQLVVDRVNNLDILEIRVEMTESMFSDEIRKIEETAKKIKNEVQSVLGIAVNIVLVEPHSLERTEGKSKRIIDKRTIK